MKRDNGAAGFLDKRNLEKVEKASDLVYTALSFSRCVRIGVCGRAVIVSSADWICSFPQRESGVGFPTRKTGGKACLPVDGIGDRLHIKGDVLDCIGNIKRSLKNERFE